MLGIIYFTLLIVFFGCNIDSGKLQDDIAKADTLTAAEIDSIRKVDTLAKYDIFPKIKYKRIFISSYSQLIEIRNEYSRENDKHKYKVLITLNRKEFRYFRKNDIIIVPDTIIDDLRAYSVFPQFYWSARDIPKIVVVTNKLQAYGCYEYGRLVRFAATNTGKERTPTYPGRYALVWKERNHRSSLDSNWVMPYTWNFHAEAGSAFHQFVMPGRPVSHSCLRQFLDDARWLYYWGDGFKKDSNRRRIPLSGTPVILIEIFDFSRKRYGPWIDLTSNKDSILTLPEDPMAVEDALIPYCQIPDGSKGSLRNRERYIHAEDTLRARGVIRPGVRLIKTLNFNDIRRRKALLKAKLEAEKKKKDMEKKLKEEANKLENPEENILEENENIENNQEEEELEEPYDFLLK